MKLICKIVFLSFVLGSNYAISAENYKLDIANTHEDINQKTSEYVIKKLSQRNINSGDYDSKTQFGVHGMETPFIKYEDHSEKEENAFKFLALAGVDSLRSSEAAWHRIADKNGEPTNTKELEYQLQMAKKYGMSHLFVVGYPPAKYTVANNKLSAVDPRYQKKYDDYLYKLLHVFRGYDVKYLELGNEVDAPEVWWKKSTPQMYVNEMKTLHRFVEAYYPQAKTVAFSATYSRSPFQGGMNGGRRFLEKSFQLGIDKYTDAYSLHHFSYSEDRGFPEYMHGLLKSHGINKPLLDTEQLDKVADKFKDSRPYDLVKIFARAFFQHKLDRMDYYLARDAYVNGKLYSTGLFDINWNPKLRLLAYAMAVDSMKGRTVISSVSPGHDVEAYILKNNSGSNFKYTVILWRNFSEDNLNSKDNFYIRNFQGGSLIEHWNLDKEYVKDNNPVLISYKPIAVYTNTIPNWKSININKMMSKFSKDSLDSSPMP